MKNNKISIMHVIDTLSIGGAERMLVDIVNGFDPEQFSISVCVSRSGLDLEKEINPAIPVQELDRKFRFDILGFRKLRKYAKEQQIDIFHVHGRTSFSFLLAAGKLGYHNKPIILHDHFGNIEFDKSIPIWFKTMGVGSLTHYICVCEKLAYWAIKAGVPEEKISVIENAVDFHRFDPFEAHNIHDLFNIPHDRKIGIMVGNIRPAKGLDILIRACREISNSNLPYFIIVGEAPQTEYMRSCYRLLKQSGFSKHFNFIGQQTDPISWIKGADFAVLPSRSESGPLVLIEYLACGLQFVAFNVGGISNQISEYLPNYFVSPENPIKFAKQLIQLTNKPKSIHNQQKNMREALAHKLFDINNRIPTIIQIYRSIMTDFR